MIPVSTASTTPWTAGRRSGACNVGTAPVAMLTIGGSIPRTPIVYNNRGCAYFEKGEYDLAIADLDKSIILNHERGGAFFARGLAHAELEHTDESLRDLKTAIAFSNKEVIGFANLFGETRTLFDKSMALLEGERGPWSIVLDEAEINKLKKWIEN